ncbi:EF-hand domain-containing protein [Sulfurovum sp.]|jgi:Ca2+-binding EF-hand superfamily protein|uniref:EF-hand domain-containing protein n=1 Tax=Sulfurovum sp. TaxID=1969726 RepID=UPI002A358C80|nr:EF-hand domain-containing protein [Sulfurovum sp.]MDY0403581.1 EF-hand domain-containing protein [Sulfurovum sp.]
MRKYILITSMLVSSSFGADLTQISTEELANEMQKRLQTMTPQERQQYRGLNAGPGRMGKCGDGGMGKMGSRRMMQMPKFSEYDLNNDGAITEQEFQEGHTQRMNKLAQEGRMLRNAGKAPAFSEIDTDKDGKINAEEFQSHQQEMQNLKCGSGPRGKMGKCGDGSMGMGKMGSRRMMQMPKFSDCDLNQDGAITEEEFTEARKKRMEKRAAEGRMLRNAKNAPSFSDIDTNHDGKIDQAEFEVHQQERMQKRGRPGKCG